MDYADAVLDEISLEGLDGITLSSLWLRLSARQPVFPLTLDAACRQYLWAAVVVASPDVEYHVLDEPRPALVLYNRMENIDKETDMVLEDPADRVELYPLAVIRDNNIVGSCPDYHTRKNVTDEIRTSNISLADVIEKYGERIVLVASQKRRQHALFHSSVDQNFIFNDKIYCVLERIGRTRREGALTNGKYSLQVWLHESPKTVFYMRHQLFKAGLVTVQTFSMRSQEGNNMSGKLIHLKRFFHEVKPITAILMEKMTKILADKPNQMEVMHILRTEMGMKESSFKKLYQTGHKYIDTEYKSTKELFPDADESLHYIRSEKKERRVRIVRLIKRYVYTVTGLEDDDDAAGGADDDDDDNTDDNTNSHEQRVYYERPLLHQVYAHMERRGETGMNQNQVNRAFSKSRLDARLLCRNLERCGVVHHIMRDVGKQREQRFVAKAKFTNSSIHKQLMHERSKILDHCKAIQDGESSIQVTASTSDSVEPSASSSAAEGITTVKTELHIDGRDKTSLRESILYMDDMKNAHSNQAKKNAHVTIRVLKRANMVIDTVKKTGVIDNLFTIQKHIIEQEAREGIKCRIDKKSLVRLLRLLEKDEQIRIYKSTKVIADKEREITLICAPHLTPEDALVKSCIESAFNRITSKAITPKVEVKKSASVAEEDGPGVVDMYPTPSLSMLEQDTSSVLELTVDHDAGRRYGFLPRMKRYQVVHEFIWYLVYGYNKRMNTPGGDTTIAESFNDGIDPDMTEENIKFKVYANEYSWRRFIPPLPSHKGYPDGWFLVGDALLILPVTLFVQIIRYNYKSPELEEILRHPIRKWTLVCHLPTHLRGSLMYKRKFVYQFFESIIHIGRMGLLSVGKRELREKEQIYVYLHKNSSIIDTTDPIKPSEECHFKHFYFDSAFVVRDYWFSLQWICMNTLFSRCEIPDEYRTRYCNHRFIDVDAGKAVGEVIDDGTIPGNHVGAGGLDSYFFSHIKRNWIFSLEVDQKPKSRSESHSTKTNFSLSSHIEKLAWSDKYKTMRPGATSTPAKPRRGAKRAGHSTQEGGRKRGRKVAAVEPATETVTDTAVEMEPTPAGDQEQAPLPEPMDEDAPGTSEPAPKRKIVTSTVTGFKSRKGGKGIKRKRKNSVVIKEVKKKYNRPKKKIGPDTRRAATKRYDKQDVEAMQRMTKERVDWTSVEDSMLLLWKVALTFLGGWRRDAIVSYAVIRDQLHRELPMSRNKTSMACQRRLVHMLKNGETEFNVRMYVGEALQDKDLVQEFLVGKVYKKTLENDNIPAALKCLEKLRQKFASSETLPIIQLPDTIEDIHGQYHMHKGQGPAATIHREIATKWDIEFSVLHNLIHCAILLDDKTGRAHELYHLFNQYPEELVNQVFTVMKADRIVTKMKANTVRKSRLHLLPSVNRGTYHMSQRYTYFWVTKYPRTIFQHAYEVYSPLRDLAQSGGTVDTPDNSWLLLEGIAGSAALVIALLASTKLVFETTLPDEIVTLDSSKPRRNKKPRVLEKTESDEEEEARINEAEEARAKQDPPQTPAPSTAPPGDTDAPPPSPPPEPPVAPSLSSVLLTNASARPVTAQKSISRAAISLAHTHHVLEGSPGDLADNLVVNSCTVRVGLRGEDTPPSDKWDFSFEAVEYISEWNRTHTNIHPRTGSVLLSRQRVLLPLKVDVRATLASLWAAGHCTYGQKDLMETLYSKVKATKIKGLTAYDLESQFGRRQDYKRCLNLLLEKKIMLRVGVLVFRYVSFEHTRPWLIHACKNVKGRGVYNEQDASEDLIQPMSLKDFPGAPVLPEDYSIRPGKPQLSTSATARVLSPPPTAAPQPPSPPRPEEPAPGGCVLLEEAPQDPPDAPPKLLLGPANLVSAGDPAALTERVLVKTVTPDLKIVDERLVSRDLLLQRTLPVEDTISARGKRKAEDKVTPGEADRKKLKKGANTGSQPAKLPVKKKPSLPALTVQTSILAENTEENSDAAIHDKASLPALSKHALSNILAENIESDSSSEPALRSPVSLLDLQRVFSKKFPGSDNPPVVSGPSSEVTEEQLTSKPVSGSNTVTLEVDDGVPAVDQSSSKSISSKQASGGDTKQKGVSSSSNETVTLDETVSEFILDDSAIFTEEVQPAEVASTPEVVSTRVASPLTKQPVSTPISQASDQPATKPTSSKQSKSPKPNAASKKSSKGISDSLDKLLQFTTKGRVRVTKPTVVQASKTTTEQSATKGVTDSVKDSIQSSIRKHLQPATPEAVPPQPTTPRSTRKSHVAVPKRILKSSQNTKPSAKPNTQTAATDKPTVSHAASPLRTTEPSEGVSNTTKVTVSKSVQEGSDSSVQTPSVHPTPPSKLSPKPSEQKTQTIHPKQASPQQNSVSSVKTISKTPSSAGATMVQLKLPNTLTKTSSMESILSHVKGLLKSQKIKPGKILIKLPNSGASKSDESKKPTRQHTPAESLPQLDGQCDDHSCGQLLSQVDGADDSRLTEDTASHSASATTSQPTFPATLTGGSPASDRVLRTRKRKRSSTYLDIAAPKANSTYQRVHLVCRPWRTPEGTVNRSILQMMLEGLMMYVMSKPGVTREGLINKYSPILQPVPLLELVEMLETIGCVDRQLLQMCERTTLFSRRCHHKLVNRDTGKEQLSFRPTQSCIIKLGQFFSQIQHPNRTASYKS